MELGKQVEEEIRESRLVFSHESQVAAGVPLALGPLVGDTGPLQPTF